MRGLLRNDLAPAVFDVAPAVRHLRDALESAGGVPVQVTGAGAVLFVLFDGRGEAAAWCDTVRARGVAADSWVAAAPVAAALREET
jgi:4-diphosphocytidyl-2C-methyl-D-erythritol kinase